jgi:hypothetical protein
VVAVGSISALQFTELEQKVQCPQKRSLVISRVKSPI